MRSRRLLALAALGAACLTSSVYASPGVSVATSPAVGHSVLVDDRGMTLYRYTEDQGSNSNCYGACVDAPTPGA